MVNFFLYRTVTVILTHMCQGPISCNQKHLTFFFFLDFSFCVVIIEHIIIIQRTIIVIILQLTSKLLNFTESTIKDILLQSHDGKNVDKYE